MAKRHGVNPDIWGKAVGFGGFDTFLVNSMSPCANW